MNRLVVTIFSTLLLLTHPKPAKPFSAPTDGLANLPLVEVPGRGPGSDCMAVFWSGDGGWAELDRAVSAGLARHGVPVLGVNSLKYFWTKRTPAQTAADLERIAGYYAAQWQKKELLLIGYSHGADILPFAANRLSAPWQSRVTMIVLLSPGLRADFEFHLSNWVGTSSKMALPILPEIRQLDSAQLLCIYGKQETDCLCPDLPENGPQKVALPGGHHFDGDYDRIVETILRAMK